MSRISYQTYRFWRPQLILMFALFTLVVVILLVYAITGNNGVPPAWFVLLYALALLWNAYWFLLRFSFRLELDTTSVRWFGVLRRGACELTALQQIRPMRLSGQVAVLEVANQPKVFILVRKGFREFTEAAATAAPGLPVRLSLTTRLLERLPGTRRFRRD